MTFVCIKTIVVNQIDTSFNLSQRHVKPGEKRTKIKKTQILLMTIVKRRE